MRSKAFVFLVVGLVAVFGLVGSGGNVSAQEGDGTLDDQLTSAAGKYGVPKELLSAMGYANTRWEMPPPSATDYEKGSLEGRGDYGIMALTKNPSGDTLGEASQLTGIPEDRLKTDRAANIEGGAAMLADLQGSNKPSDINGWYDAVSRYGGGALYANQVYQTLKDGAKATVDGKEVTLAPQPNAETRTLYNTQAGADYPRGDLLRGEFQQLHHRESGRGPDQQDRHPRYAGIVVLGYKLLQGPEGRRLRQLHGPLLRR